MGDDISSNITWNNDGWGEAYRPTKRRNRT